MPADRSLGAPLEGIEYVIMDADDPTKEVPFGQSGLLLVRGSTVVTPEHGYIADAPADVFQTFGDKTYYVTGDIVKNHTTEQGDTVVKFVDRASRFSKINGEIVPHGALESVINGVLPPTVDGTPQCVVVEGNTNAKGVPQLVAYIVAGRGPNGGWVDRNGNRLDFARLNGALMDAFQGDAKFGVSEIRIVSSIELLGTDKMNLGMYKKGAKQPFDGDTLRR